MTLVLALASGLACTLDAELEADLSAEDAYTIEEPAASALELAADDPTLAAIPVDDCPEFRALGVCPVSGPDGDDPEDPQEPPSSSPPDPEPEPLPERVEPEPEPEPEPLPERVVDEDCEIVPVETIVLWPPSHKLVPFTLADCVAEFRGCGDADIDPDTDMEIVSVRSDEYENGNGDGNTCEDTFMITGTSSFELRSERSGGGDGRYYTVDMRYTDAGEQASYASCHIVVPTGKQSPAVDSGCELCLDADHDDFDACETCPQAAFEC